ncbi:HIT family protein [bacterium]|jgi:histidine triad (HIT) family protein|nr:HIT family protein [bacterium]MBT4649489.1 HIT family protein [bacterium]
MDCLFCKIINKELPAKIIYEDEKYLAFLDINPITAGHTLLILKDHVDNFTHLSDQQAADLASMIHKIAPKIIEILGADAYNLGINNGAAAGQIIDHVHWHIIPRYSDDALVHWSCDNQAKEQLDNVFSKLENKL